MERAHGSVDGEGVRQRVSGRRGAGEGDDHGFQSRRTGGNHVSAGDDVLRDVGERADARGGAADGDAVHGDGGRRNHRRRVGRYGDGERDVRAARGGAAGHGDVRASTALRVVKAIRIKRRQRGACDFVEALGVTRSSSGFHRRSGIVRGQHSRGECGGRDR